jgi:ABC-type multidrug transport system ATPase subunit
MPERDVAALHVPALEVSGVVAGYRGFELGPVDLVLAPGEVLTLIGTNGSGKTTFIRSVLGLHGLRRGEVRFEGRSLPARRPAELAAVGYMTDSPRDLLGSFSAREYWRYCLIAHERAARRRAPQVLERAERLARLLDFPSDSPRQLGELSLGTTRKAQLIAATMTQPRLLVLDEPFIGLDFIAARAVEALLLELRAAGTTIVIANHDLGLAARIADRVLLLHGGVPLLNAPLASLGGHQGLEAAIQHSLDAARGVEG